MCTRPFRTKTSECFLFKHVCNPLETAVAPCRPTCTPACGGKNCFYNSLTLQLNTPNAIVKRRKCSAAATTTDNNVKIRHTPPEERNTWNRYTCMFVCMWATLKDKQSRWQMHQKAQEAIVNTNKKAANKRFVAKVMQTRMRCGTTLSCEEYWKQQNKKKTITQKITATPRNLEWSIVNGKHPLAMT